MHLQEVEVELENLIICFDQYMVCASTRTIQYDYMLIAIEAQTLAVISENHFFFRYMHAHHLASH